MIQFEVLTGTGLEGLRKITKTRIRMVGPLAQVVTKTYNQTSKCYGLTQVLTDVSQILIKTSPLEARYLFIYLRFKIQVY
jgi:hypothetical protein